MIGYISIRTRRDNGWLVYGFRQVGGKANEVKKEAEVIDQIKSYRESGNSYQKIAHILNNLKFKLK